MVVEDDLFLGREREERRWKTREKREEESHSVTNCDSLV